MSIHQTKRQSDLEKRLQILRRQVYGKSPDKPDKIRLDQRISKPESQKSDMPIHRTTDLTYLNQDLLKILIFSSLAIGAQIVLFILSQNHIINLKFF